MNLTSPPIPSISQLIKSTSLAFIAALILLMTVILPAEYSIDPLGTGRVLGLNSLAASPEDSQDLIPGAEILDAAGSSVSIHTSPLQTETKSITLEAFEGIEMKATMTAGDHFVFSWNSGEKAVFTDMHGEKLDNDDEFSTYWKEKQQLSGKGAFTAPFDGTHGWYWQNMSDETVVIELQVSGFYEKLGVKK